MSPVLFVPREGERERRERDDKLDEQIETRPQRNMWVCLCVLGVVRKWGMYKSSVDFSLNYSVIPTRVHFPTPNPAIIKLSAFYQEQFTISFK